MIIPVIVYIESEALQQHLLCNETIISAGVFACASTNKQCDEKQLLTHSQLWATSRDIFIDVSVSNYFVTLKRVRKRWQMAKPMFSLAFAWEHTHNYEVK